MGPNATGRCESESVSRGAIANYLDSRAFSIRAAESAANG